MLMIVESTNRLYGTLDFYIMMVDGGSPSSPAFLWGQKFRVSVGLISGSFEVKPLTKNCGGACSHLPATRHQQNFFSTPTTSQFTIRNDLVASCRLHQLLHQSIIPFLFLGAHACFACCCIDLLACWRLSRWEMHEWKIQYLKSLESIH